MLRKRHYRWFLLFLLMTWTPPAYAIDGWGPRFGFSGNPNQMHLGAHLEAGEIAPRLMFRPNFEVGVGDQRTITAVSFEVDYQFGAFDVAWRPYLGGGTGIQIVDRNYDSSRDDTDLETGITLVGGMRHLVSSGNALFSEIKLGWNYQPDVKLTMGLTFR